MARIPCNGFAARARRLALAIVVAGGAPLAPTAQAGLGEPVDSVERDHAAVHGSALSVTPMLNYDLHETTTVDGARLRQYATRAGTVFAVAWSGPALPNLKLVLGKSYDAYVAAASAHRGSHHVLNIVTPDLVLNITKHARGFTGNAYQPALLPAGTTAQELR
jgi:hypothetical protein